MISETLPNWGGLKVENFGGKFKFQNLSSWNTLFSTLGGDEITFSGFIWGQELITKCPCWVKLHITEDNFCHFFKPPQFRFFLSKNVKLFEAIRSPLIVLHFLFQRHTEIISLERSVHRQVPTFKWPYCPSLPGCQKVCVNMLVNIISKSRNWWCTTGFTAAEIFSLSVARVITFFLRGFETADERT